MHMYAYSVCYMYIYTYTCICFRVQDLRLRVWGLSLYVYVCKHYICRERCIYIYILLNMHVVGYIGLWKKADAQEYWIMQ